MIIEVDVHSPAVRLLEPEVFNRFHISANGDAAAVVTAMGDAAREADKANHLFVRISSVIELAEGEVGAGWQQDFQKMIAYAAAHGWVDADGTHVMAHIESLAG